VAEPQQPSRSGARFVAAPHPVTAISPKHAFRILRAAEGMPNDDSGTPSTVWRAQLQRQAPSKYHWRIVKLRPMICSTPAIGNDVLRDRDEMVRQSWQDDEICQRFIWQRKRE